MYRQPALRVLALALCGVVALAGTACRATADADAAGPSALERSLFAEDWQAAVHATAAGGGEPDTAPRRALRAHALMLTNRNNESVSLFLSLDESGRRAWSQWTADLLERNPAEPVAHYLHGDALARIGDWTGARQAIAVALGDQAPRVRAMSHPAAAFIAEGVVLIQLGQPREADTALTRATTEDSRLAEAFASLGTSRLLRSAAQGAADSFRQALVISPHYALAINGLACAEYGLGHPEAADAGFAAAAREMPLDLFVANRLALRTADGPGDDRQSGNADPGMQLTLTRGLVDQQSYKNRLTPAQIVQGQWNMDHIGRPIADAIGGFGGKDGLGPIGKFVGAQLNRHFDQSTLSNSRAMQQQGLSLDDYRPGGVTTDQSHAHVDRGHWPVNTWFGLALAVGPEPAATTGRGDPP